MTEAKKTMQVPVYHEGRTLAWACDEEIAATLTGLYQKAIKFVDKADESCPFCGGERKAEPDLEPVSSG